MEWEWAKDVKIFGYQPGLQTKIMAALALVGLLPLGFVTYRLISLNRRAFSEQVLRVHALSSQATASQVENYVQSLVTVAQAGATNPTLHLNPNSQVAQQLQADLLASSKEELFAIVSMTADQREILRVQKRGRSSLVDHLLPLAVPGKVLLVSYQDLPWLIISAKFPEGGDLRLLASGRQIRDMMDPTELGDGAILVLTDHTGTPLLGSQSGIQLPADLMDIATSLRVSGSGKFELADQSTVLGSYSPLSSLPWHVITWQPVSVAEEIAQTMRRRAGEAFGLAFLITALLGLIAYLSIVRPIRTLLGANPGWGGGSGDEIKQLERAFSLLSQQDQDEDSTKIEEIFLGRYQVLKKVGQGGMGAVFHGFDPKLQRPIALKTLLLNSGRSVEKTKDQVAKLLKEATTAANINHANIVAVYDVKDADKYAYVAMEYVDGSSLSEYLEHHGPLEPKQAIPLFLEIAKGIDAAHAKAVVHRDIKPANILLGKDHSVKIADFGISQLLTSLEGQQEKVAGTPGFLSPEVLKNKPFTKAADLFALGVTMYRTLTGNYPFTGATIKSILLKTIGAKPRPPHLINPKIPEALSDIVMRLLEKDPKERLTNSKVLIYGLEALLDGSRWTYSGISTEPDSGEKTMAPEELQYVATSTDLYSNPGN